MSAAGAGPIAIRETGSKWERLVGVPCETWILREEFTGNLLGIVSRMEQTSRTWSIKVFLPNCQTAEGVAIEDSPIPSAFSEAEHLLAKAGTRFQPVSIGGPRF